MSISEYLLKRVKRLKREVNRVGMQANELLASQIVRDLQLQELREDLSDQKGRITRLRTQFTELKEIVVTAADRIETAVQGIAGDITGLKDSYATLSAAYDEAMANANAKTQAAVEKATADARADFESQLSAVADKLEGIDAQTPAAETPTEPAPEAPVDPVDPGQPTEPEAPVDPEVPADPAPVEPEAPVEPTPDPAPVTDFPVEGTTGDPGSPEVTGLPSR